MPTVLISFPGGAGVVQLDGGEIHLTHDVRDGGCLLSGRGYIPVKAWLDDDRSLVGGLLPSGAVSAEVVDDRGIRVDATVRSGVYAAIIEQPDDGQDPVVCCRDAAGSVVRRPLPIDYALTLIDDATEPCPACGAVAYDECVPRGGWGGGHAHADGATTIPRPIVVCRICGHAQRQRVTMRIMSPNEENDAANAEQIVRARAAQRVQRWREQELALQAIAFPIYVAESWPVSIKSRNRTSNKVTALTVAHPSPRATVLEEPAQIEITTSTRRSHQSDFALARLALEHWVHHEIDHSSSTDPSRFTDRSSAAITLSLQALARRRRAAVLTAIRSETDIAVNGVREPFRILAISSGCWAGVRRHGNVTITITGRDVDPAAIRLQIIPNPAQLLGPKPDEAPGQP